MDRVGDYVEPVIIHCWQPSYTWGDAMQAGDVQITSPKDLVAVYGDVSQYQT